MHCTYQFPSALRRSHIDYILDNGKIQKEAHHDRANEKERDVETASERII